MMAAVRITEAVMAAAMMAVAETAVVVEDIINFVMSRPPNKSPEPPLALAVPLSRFTP